MADFLPGKGCAQANFSQFLRRENVQMAAFLRRCLEVGDRGRTIEQIRDSKAKPSQQLADEQKVVDEKALALARPAPVVSPGRLGRPCSIFPEPP